MLGIFLLYFLLTSSVIGVTRSKVSFSSPVKFLYSINLYLYPCFSSPQAPYRSFPPKAAKTHSFRCVSSSHQTRFAGLRREPCFPPITAQSAEVTSHTAWESPLQRGFKSHSHKRLTFAFAGESGYTRHPSP